MKNGIKAVVLAAGKGTRLRTEGVDLPKVLRQAAGRPLVVGYEREKVLAAYPEYPHAVQEPQQGTGHAVQCAREALAGFDGSVLVCYGDMPLMRRATYESLIETHKREGNDCTLLSAVSDEELPYGRIVRKSDGSFSHIVEDKDCTPEEKAIRELNVGVYVFESRPLWEAIDQLRPNNAQGEYYLTDAPAYILSRGGRVGACPTCTAEEMLGVNTVEQLAQVEELVGHHGRLQALRRPDDRRGGRRLRGGRRRRGGGHSGEGRPRLRPQPGRGPAAPAGPGAPGVDGRSPVHDGGAGAGGLRRGALHGLPRLGLLRRQPPVPHHDHRLRPGDA